MGRYLVTGGCGFIGSHLVDKLIALNHDVTVIDNLSTGKRENFSPLAKLIVGDICDQSLMYDVLNEMDGCFHLAAIVSVFLSKEDWLGTNRVNLVGTLNIFEAAARHRRENKKIIPIVYTSSSAVYGDCQELPFSELSLAMPLSGYGADKLACELHGRIATTIHEVPTIGLRFFNVYGPRQDPKSPYSGVISIFMNRIQSGRHVEIFGDGNQTRDFIYVSDVVEALVFFMGYEKLAPSIINVCTGKAVTINFLIKLLESMLGKSVEKHYLSNRPGDALYSCGDPSKAIKLGWKAKNSLEQGLRAYLESLK